MTTEETRWIDLSWCRLVYGLDYKGNVCGDRRAKPNLKEYQVRYWMNPNQLYWSGVYPDRYKLSTARSICLRNCPTTFSAGTGNTSQLSWVCDYPEGIYSGMSMRDWEQRNYDYFDLLTPDQIASSRNLTGPCYPVLFESVNCMKSSYLSTTVCEGNHVHGGVVLLRDFCTGSCLRNGVYSIFPSFAF
jgi:choline transporter-like protein 2/4/5